MNFCLIKNQSSFLNRFQCELELRINSHPSAPNKDLLRVSQSNHLIETSDDINYIDLLFTIGFILEFQWLSAIWIYLNNNLFLINSKCTKLIISPSKNLAFCCKQGRECITTCNFDNRNRKINLKWKRVDIFKLLQIFLKHDVLLLSFLCKLFFRDATYSHLHNNCSLLTIIITQYSSTYVST